MKNHFLKFTFALIGICLLLPLLCCIADENPTVETVVEPAKVEEKTAPSAVAPIAVKFALAQNISGLGRVVAFSLTARNTTNEVQTLVFNTAQNFAMTATQLNGQEKAKAPMWSSSNGKLFASAERSEKLQPNESKTWTAIWQGDDSLGNPAPRGQYIFEAIVMANGGLQAPPLLLDVRPEGIREMTPRKNDLDDGPVANLETEKETYQPGESVSLKLTVRNQGTQTSALTFLSGQRYDFAVRPAPKGKFDPKQKIVWQWSAGRAFTMALAMQPFAPGATLQFSEKWDLKDTKGKPVPPGKYMIESILTTNRSIAAAPLLIEVKK